MPVVNLYCEKCREINPKYLPPNPEGMPPCGVSPSEELKRILECPICGGKMTQTYLDFVKNAIEHEGTEAALVFLTQDGYLHWAEGRELVESDLRSVT